MIDMRLLCGYNEEIMGELWGNCEGIVWVLCGDHVGYTVCDMCTVCRRKGALKSARGVGRCGAMVAATLLDLEYVLEAVGSIGRE